MVSIILTCYENDRNLMDNAIDSCLNQDVPVEIIVVDGGSRTLIKNDSILKADKYIYTRENIMQGGAMNLGIQNSKYDLIIGLDSDDYLYKNILGSMVSFIHDADVVFGMMTNELGENTLIPMDVTRENLDVCNPIFWSSLFRKSAWVSVGGFDKVVYQDYRYWCKLFMAGCKFKYIDKVIYNHARRKGSLTDREDSRIEELNKEAREPLWQK
jgi:glycosyltransferase involved in cell wall biosynthesis